MTPTSLLETAEKLPGAADAEPLYEIIDGRKVELPPMGIFETDIASILGADLKVFARAHQLGWVEVEGLFHLANQGRQRRPDVAFVSYQRWPKQRALPRGAAWPVVPDLVVEVMSPTDFAVEVLLKVQEYFQAGTRSVWVVWPNVKQIYVYESPTQVRILTAADDLDGTAVVPGFRLPVASLFEATVEEEPGQATAP